MKSIHSNAPVFVHSDLFKSLPIYKSLIKSHTPTGLSEAALQYLNIKYGSNLIFPAFNYDFGKSYIFDIDNDPIQVGGLPELIRQSKTYKRSQVPFFSVLTNITELTKYHKSCSPFGKNSTFEWLYENDGKIIFFGALLKSFTFIHYIEGLIPTGPLYRYNKEFIGSTIISNKEREVKCEMHVRPLNTGLNYDWNLIETDLRLEGILKNEDKQGTVFSALCSELTSYFLSRYSIDPLYGLDQISRTNFINYTDNCKSRVKLKDFE